MAISNGGHHLNRKWTSTAVTPNVNKTVSDEDLDNYNRDKIHLEWADVLRFSPYLNGIEEHVKIESEMKQGTKLSHRYYFFSEAVTKMAKSTLYFFLENAYKDPLCQRIQIYDLELQADGTKVGQGLTAHIKRSDRSIRDASMHGKMSGDASLEDLKYKLMNANSDTRIFVTYYQYIKGAIWVE